MGKLDLKPIPNSFCIRIAARDEYNSMRLYLSTDAKSVTGLYLAELPEHNIHHILETRYTLEQVIRWTDEGTWSVSAGHTEYKRAKQAYLKSKIKNRLSFNSKPKIGKLSDQMSELMTAVYEAYVNLKTKTT